MSDLGKVEVMEILEDAKWACNGTKPGYIEANKVVVLASYTLELIECMQELNDVGGLLDQAKHSIETATYEIDSYLYNEK